MYALLLRGDGGAGPSALQWVGGVGAYYKVAGLLLIIKWPECMSYIGLLAFQ